MNLQAKPELKRNYEKFKQLSRITLTINEPRHISQITVKNKSVVSKCKRKTTR